MSKSQTQSKKKRKREKISRSSSEDLQLEQGHKSGSGPDEIQDDINVDNKGAEKNSVVKKRKKKKKTKSARDCQGEKTSTSDSIESVAKSASAAEQQQKDPVEETQKLAKQKRKKKKKKRKRQNISSTGVSSSDEPLNNDDSGGSKVDFHGEDGGDNGVNETVLEGSMVSDILVLIDRKAGKVYSATEERLENGERKEVGRLDGKGQVVLFHNTEEAENEEKDQKALPNSSDTNDDVESNGPSSSFPYEVDPDDHCESPLQAYKDIAPLLESYTRWIRKRSNSELSIYDPYFCNGRVARHLESLGFPGVYNRKEDCYKVWRDPSIYPSYDIFMTNPPYSCDHIEKLMKHVTSKQNEKKPWMLLMPNFVHKKDYYQKFTAGTGHLPIYLVPKKRYIYQPPPNLREKKASSTHKKSSPFVSMWYLWGGSREVTDEWYRLLRKQNSLAFDVARSKSALRDLRRKPKNR